VLVRFLLLISAVVLISTVAVDFVLNVLLGPFVPSTSLPPDDSVRQTVTGVLYQFMRYSLLNLVMAPVALAFASLIIEHRTSARAALIRGFTLIRGAWWRTAVGFLTLAVLSGWIPWFTAWALAVLTETFPAVASVDGLGRTVRTAPESLFGTILYVLLGPLFCVGLIVLYYDRRSRVDVEPQ
jgi:hypothetical protein